LLEKTGNRRRALRFYAPINGVIAELGVREGHDGDVPVAMLFRLVDLSSVWVNGRSARGAGHVAASRNGGRSARAELSRVRRSADGWSAILPEVNAATRTLPARVELAKSPAGG